MKARPICEGLRLAPKMRKKYAIDRTAQKLSFVSHQEKNRGSLRRDTYDWLCCIPRRIERKRLFPASMIKIALGSKDSAHFPWPTRIR
jgi:hypothetical protein